jgi:hypothetical protein
LAPHWSDWQPSTSRMFDGAQEIAGRISSQYQLNSGEPFATVQSGEMEYDFEPIGVAVQPTGGQIEVLDGPALLYGIRLHNENDTTTDRHARDRMLKRAALELALYSFRYLDDVTMVAVGLPAVKTADGTRPLRAVFFRPGDLLPQLQVPLARTLAPETPRPRALSTSEAARVDSLVLRHLFDTSIQSLDGRRSYFVLSEPEIVDGS